MLVRSMDDFDMGDLEAMAREFGGEDPAGAAATEEEAVLEAELALETALESGDASLLARAIEAATASGLLPPEAISDAEAELEDLLLDGVCATEQQAQAAVPTPTPAADAVLLIKTEVGYDFTMAYSRISSARRRAAPDRPDLRAPPAPLAHAPPAGPGRALGYSTT